MKNQGARGKGDAKFVWKKGRGMAGYPLNDEHAYKLTELAEIRARLFDGKVRSDEKMDDMFARQEALVQMLGEDDVKIYFIDPVTFRKEG